MSTFRNFCLLAFLVLLAQFAAAATSPTRNPTADRAQRARSQRQHVRKHPLRHTRHHGKVRARPGREEDLTPSFMWREERD